MTRKVTGRGRFDEQLALLDDLRLQQLRGQGGGDLTSSLPCLTTSTTIGKGTGRGDLTSNSFYRTSTMTGKRTGRGDLTSN